ncbi:DUF421 domain-containing protein [Jeotgalibacillus marinus]|uniref:DUF421 domain-containing protein n=1 Tax=Jeotgalibacillus marinus TaxID=86667 RepID=A0ABV3Q0B1_9BACL
MPEYLTIIIRATSILVVLFFVTKMLGKKQISELSFFEYIIGNTVGSIGAEIITGLDNSFIHGVIGIIAFISIPFAANLLAIKSKHLREFLDGKGTVLIRDGNIIEKNLKKERYTPDELMKLLRRKSVFQFSDVEFAILESTGELNVLLKREKQPLTPSDINLKVAPIKEPRTVIMDGKMINEALEFIGKSNEWMTSELEKLGVSVESIFIGQLESNGQLIIDQYDDSISTNESVDEGPYLVAILNKCQADLELFALSAHEEQAKLMYIKNSEKLKKVIQDTKKYLQ